MKIVAISDTHAQHRALTVPSGDVLIHAGDITHQGEISIFEDFLLWFSKHPHPYKIFIGGNHDFNLVPHHSNYERSKQLISKHDIIYLHHESCTISKLNIFGSPYTPAFNGWAFNVEPPRLPLYWDAIPACTDILITHGPCRDRLDLTADNRSCGDDALLKKVQTLNLKLHIFGHIHRNENQPQIKKENNLTYVNASVLDELYMMKNEPVVINLV